VLVAALFVAALFVAALALTFTVVGPAAVGAPSVPTLDGGHAGRLGRGRKGRDAGANRQQQEDLRQGSHGFTDHFFTIAATAQRISRRWRA
jgi:hypothetical protein